MLGPLEPLGVVTSTLAEPALPAPVVQVIEVAVTPDKGVQATPPTVTAVAPVKLVPVIVTEVFPVTGPEEGEMLETVGVPGNEAPGTNGPPKNMP